MRTVFKMLLAPVWLMLFLLKWTSLIATGIASVLFRVGGMLLLLIGAAYMVFGFDPFLTIRVFVAGIGAFLAPYILTVVKRARRGSESKCWNAID